MTGPTGVVLRAVVESDLPILYGHQRDPVSAARAAFQSRDWEPFLAHWSGILTDGTVIARAIVVDDRLVGSIVSFVRDGVREVGYWLARDAWGRGIATAAVLAFLLEDRSRPLYAIVAEHNLASQRVATKAGFVEVERRAADDGTLVVFRLDEVPYRSAP